MTPLDYRRVKAVIAEYERRRAEALRIYEPMPFQEAFHKSDCLRRLVIGPNRSGKTLAACCDVAWALTGRHPYLKYPESGVCYCIAANLKRLGDVVWKGLARAGAFLMIRDEDTGDWRAYRPAADRHRRHEAKPAPPLLPPRYIKEIAWENKKENIPSRVTLATGWEIQFFSADGVPPRGTRVHLAWFTEEIPTADAWYPEIAMRLIDCNGRMIWDATPQSGTDQLLRLHEMAEERVEVNGRPAVEEFNGNLEENPHLTDEQKAQMGADLTEDEYTVRFLGEFVQQGYKVYPEFSPRAHLVDDFPVPPEWTRYAAVDSGLQVCAALFAAVPPEEDHVYLYKELYVPRCTATRFGEEFAAAARDDLFQAFLIDHRGGRRGDTGTGLTVERQYSEALKQQKVASITTGHDFLWGCDDVKAGIEAAHKALHVRGKTGTPRLKVFRSLKHFQHEIKYYHYKRDPRGRVTDKPVDKNDHTLDCLRYLACHDLKYVKPVRPKRQSLVWKAFERLRGGGLSPPYVSLAAGA